MEELYILFDRYLSQELEGQELADFEAMLQSDADMKEQLEVYKSVQENLPQQWEHEKGAVKAEANIRQIHQEYFQEKTEGAKIRRLSFGRWAAAASVLVLLFAAWWLFPSNNGLDAFSDHPNLSLTVRSDSSDELIEQAEKAFNEEDYKAALPLLTDLYAKDSLPKVMLFKGIAAMETGQYDQAQNAFKALENIDDFKEASEWYNALNKARAGEDNAALTILNQIGEGSDYYVKAQELIKVLEK